MDYSKIKATWWSGNCYHIEQLKHIISSTDIKAYAYILHDKDKQESSEELKKPHYHLLVQFYTNQRGSWFKQFASDDMGTVLAQPCYHPRGAFNYLTHHTPTAIKQGKHLYDDSEVTSTIENLDEGSDDKKQTNTEKFFAKLYAGVSNMELQAEFPTIYAQYGVGKIEMFRQDYLKDKYGNNDRDIKVTFIYGATRLGKTTFVYNSHERKDICRITNYKTGTFENYNTHKVLMLDEFTGKLDIEFVNNLLDRLPLELPARYANRTACFTEVYVISNLPMSELYREAPPEVRTAFENRFHNIIKFTAFKTYHYEMQNKMRVLSEQEKADLPF